MVVYFIKLPFRLLFKVFRLLVWAIRKLRSQARKPRDGRVLNPPLRVVSTNVVYSLEAGGSMPRLVCGLS